MNILVITKKSQPPQAKFFQVVQVYIKQSTLTIQTL